MTDKGNEPEQGKRAFRPKQAAGPIALMVVLIVVTMSLALWVGPYFEAMGISSSMSEYADNPLYAFLFLGFVILFAVVILILRKFLKRRRLNLKYVFAVAVFFSMLYILFPLLDIAVNGVPEVWEDIPHDAEDTDYAFPLDPADPGKGFLMLSNDSFHIISREEHSYGTTASVDSISSFFQPHFNRDLGLISAVRNGEIGIWTYDTEGNLYDAGTISSPGPDLEPLGFQLGVVETPTSYRHEILSFWGSGSNWSVSSSPLSSPDDHTEWTDVLGPSSTPYRPAAGWTYDRNWMFNDTGLRSVRLLENGGPSISSNGYGDHPDIRWMYQKGDGAVYYSGSAFDGGTEGGLVHLDLDTLEDTPIRAMSEVPPLRISYTREGDESELMIVDGMKLTDIFNEESVGYTWSHELVGVYQREPDGEVIVVDSESVEVGRFERKDRMQTWIYITSLVIAGGIMVLLLKIPKWWIVDLAGVLMGAGVVAMMGFSFPILFTLLLMVLLAIYDAVAVYKTKHMISLADAVVESKMPILLVFPMNWSYRYEDETNLMDPKRKRESLFMGLGDVIIPGILVVSAYAWLPPAGPVYGIGGPLLVSIMTLAGMLIGFSVLMRWVIKGKAHAGLPPLNGGAILGFLLGHLLVYGTIVFW